MTSSIVLFLFTLKTVDVCLKVTFGAFVAAIHHQVSCSENLWKQRNGNDFTGSQGTEFYAASNSQNDWACRSSCSRLLPRVYHRLGVGGATSGHPQSSRIGPDVGRDSLRAVQQQVRTRRHTWETGMESNQGTSRQVYDGPRCTATSFKQKFPNDPCWSGCKRWVFIRSKPDTSKTAPKTWRTRKHSWLLKSTKARVMLPTKRNLLRRKRRKMMMNCVNKCFIVLFNLRNDSFSQYSPSRINCSRQICSLPGLQAQKLMSLYYPISWNPTISISDKNW